MDVRWGSFRPHTCDVMDHPQRASFAPCEGMWRDMDRPTSSATQEVACGFSPELWGWLLRSGAGGRRAQAERARRPRV